MTPWTAAHQASLSITSSQSLLKLMSIELVRPSKLLILCHPLLLPPSILHNIRGFSYESVLCNRCPNYWSFSFPGDSDGKASAYNVGDWVRSQHWKEPLEKEMTAHCNTLAWKIRWTEESGRLQSMGSQRVGHY